MSKYIDGFVLPLPKEKLEQYTENATLAATVWREHGALEYIESVGEDITAENMVSFPKLADAKDGETVVMAYIVYESREHRDTVNTKVMADPRIKGMCESGNPAFDYTRMAYGGFKTIAEA